MSPQGFARGISDRVLGAMYSIVFVVLSGILTGLAFYGGHFSLLAWIALVPLLIAIRGRGPLVSFALCFLSGICFYAVWSPWLLIPSSVRVIDAFLVWAYCSLYFGLFGVLCSFAGQFGRLPLLLGAPVAWVTVEFLRTNAFYLAMPLSQLGHSQYTSTELIQLASLTGVYGLTFLIVMVNALFAEMIMRRSLPVVSTAVVMLLLGASLTYGAWRLSVPPSGKEFQLSVIQPNIPQHRKWGREFRDDNMRKQVQLSLDAARDSAVSLIVWPEAAVTGFLQKELGLQKQLSGLARQSRTWLLVGGAGRPKLGSRAFRETTAYNSAFLIHPEGAVKQQYSKILPLPFGEYVPFQGWFPWPDYYIQSTGGYTPGDEYTVFNADGLQFASVICWEMYFPHLARDFIRHGAQLLVNITNEAWFGDSDASRQFFAVSVFRAVENGVYVARSANTGISGFIDPRGRVLSVVEQDGRAVEVEGFQNHSVRLLSEVTPYTRFGDIFALGNLMLCGMVLIVSVMRRFATPVRVS